MSDKTARLLRRGQRNCKNAWTPDCASAQAQQARNEPATRLHRLKRAVNRAAPRRIAGRTRADPVIRARGTEGVGAHPWSPVRVRQIVSSTGIHGSACDRMNGQVGVWRGGQSARPERPGFDAVGAASATARPQRLGTKRSEMKKPPRGRTGGGRFEKQEWQGCADSNRRPSVLETDALPTELHPCSALERCLYRRLGR